jgi:hypothetical protein
MSKRAWKLSGLTVALAASFGLAKPPDLPIDPTITCAPAVVTEQVVAAPPAACPACPASAPVCPHSGRCADVPPTLERLSQAPQEEPTFVQNGPCELARPAKAACPYCAKPDAYSAKPCCPSVPEVSVLDNLRKLAQARQLFQQGELCRKAGQLEHACEYYEQINAIAAGCSYDHAANQQLTTVRDAIARAHQPEVPTGEEAAEVITTAPKIVVRPAQRSPKIDWAAKVQKFQLNQVNKLLERSHAALQAGERDQALKLAEKALRLEKLRTKGLKKPEQSSAVCPALPPVDSNVVGVLDGIQCECELGMCAGCPVAKAFAGCGSSVGAGAGALVGALMGRTCDSTTAVGEEACCPVGGCATSKCPCLQVSKPCQDLELCPAAPVTHVSDWVHRVGEVSVTGCGTSRMQLNMGVLVIKVESGPHGETWSFGVTFDCK